MQVSARSIAQSLSKALCITIGLHLKVAWWISCFSCIACMMQCMVNLAICALAPFLCLTKHAMSQFACHAWQLVSDLQIA